MVQNSTLLVTFFLLIKISLPWGIIGVGDFIGSSILNIYWEKSLRYLKNDKAKVNDKWKLFRITKFSLLSQSLSVILNTLREILLQIILFLLNPFYD